jgi:hypothetical protein
MRGDYARSLCVVASLSRILFAQEPAPNLEQALKVVRAHVERLETSVPNFICKEQINSRLYMDHKVRKETKAQCVLTTTRTRNQHRSMFAETRADMIINGKRSKRNEIAGPFVWHGGPAYGDLHFLFNSDRGAICLDRQSQGLVKLGDKEALFIQTDASSEVGRNQDCVALHEDSTDNIWLDAKTLNVMRIESHNPPATRIPGADLTLTVDYAPVVFDGEEYWLPSHFISRLDFPGTTQYLRYEAFFSEYHKFGVDSVIHIDPIQ